MKQIAFSVFLSFTTLFGFAQMPLPVQSGIYEAVNWKLWLLDETRNITLPAPARDHETKAALKMIKQGLTKLDQKKMETIHHWNAGAPSYRWNQVILELLEQKPEVMLRIPASWMNIAIYDATILAWKEKLRYQRKRPQQLDPKIKPVIAAPRTYAYPCEHSVTAAAAAKVLAYFFPEKADSILQLAHTASQTRIDAGVQLPDDVSAGWRLGEMVANRIIEKARDDGSAKKWDGNMNTKPNKWTGTYPMGITLSSFTPMVIRSADQFRLQPPPDFEQDMLELKNFKQTFTSRSKAYYWASHGPEVWNDLVSKKMFEYRLSDDAPAAARIYTVLNVAYHDAVIAIFDSKYAFWGIRPSQYDTTFKPLISTPPFPGYPSGHAAGAATTSAVLEYFFPADAKEFHKLAQECADSRFYAGIHFRTDNEAALKMGTAVGKYVVASWMSQAQLNHERNFAKKEKRPVIRFKANRN